MSPVARRQRGHTGRALGVAAAGVGLAVALAFGVAALANQGQVDVRLGDDTYPAGNAEGRADEIAETGPFLLPDLAGGQRDIVLQHLGTDPDEGWLALAARPAGVSRDCFVQWQADEAEFRLLDGEGEESGDCDGRSYPADGGDLPRYPVRVVDGDLEIDINADARATTTTG
jgi:hypothetical protein